MSGSLKAGDAINSWWVGAMPRPQARLPGRQPLSCARQCAHGSRSARPAPRRPLPPAAPARHLRAHPTLQPKTCSARAPCPRTCRAGPGLLLLHKGRLDQRSTTDFTGTKGSVQLLVTSPNSPRPSSLDLLPSTPHPACLPGMLPGRSSPPLLRADGRPVSAETYARGMAYDGSRGPSPPPSQVRACCICCCCCCCCCRIPGAALTALGAACRSLCSACLLPRAELGARRRRPLPGALAELAALAAASAARPE